jgi:energy-coupling factor transporter transmembrane protein EcfT
VSDSVFRGDRFRINQDKKLIPPGRDYISKTLREIANFWDRSVFRSNSKYRRPDTESLLTPPRQVLATLVFLVGLSFCTELKSLSIGAMLVLVLVGNSILRKNFTLKDFFGGGFGLAIIFSILSSGPASINIFAHSSSPVICPLVTLPKAFFIGPLEIPRVIGITSEGLTSSASLMLRVLSSCGLTLWLFLSLGWLNLFRGLRSLGVPALPLQVAAMMLIFTHMLVRRSEDFHFAKKSRVVCREKAKHGRAWVTSRIARVWEESLRLMDDVQIAMEARGFKGEARFEKWR